jgi:hypothetical protein
MPKDAAGAVFADLRFGDHECRGRRLSGTAIERRDVVFDPRT